LKALRKGNVLRFLVYHGVALCIVLFLVFIYQCPMVLLFNLPCPSCGITRAYLAALRLDFASAFGHHPLFFFVAPVILYAAHKNVLKSKLSEKAETLLFFGMILLFIAVYIHRLVYNGF